MMKYQIKGIVISILFIVAWLNNAEDSPMVSADSIEEVAELPPATGYVFYPEETNQ